MWYASLDATPKILWVSSLSAIFYFLSKSLKNTLPEGRVLPTNCCGDEHGALCFETTDFKQFEHQLQAPPNSDAVVLAVVAQPSVVRHTHGIFISSERKA